jgi:hypothetical protein
LNTLDAPTPSPSSKRRFVAFFGRAKDGESLASAVEPILGDMVEWLYRKALTNLLAKMPVGRGRAKTNSSKVKQRY